MNRRQAREQAFLLLFQYKFQPDDMEHLLERFFEENNAADQSGYIEDVVKGVISKKEEIDNVINEFSKDWDVDRLSSVSLAVLRLGVYEIMYIDDIPSAVSVNEAVALAKEFEGEEAAPFINGIMGKIKEKFN